MSTEDPPPQIALYHLATGHYLSHALCLVARLGIADLLNDGPRNAKELAEATGMHAPSLNRLLRLVASAGVLAEREDGSFELTAIGGHLCSAVPGSARAMVMLFAGERMQDAWRELEYSVRTGHPVFRKRGVEDPFTDPRRTAEDNAIFDAAMADLTRLIAIAVLAAYDFAPFRSVVDVGGGNGALLIGILKATPQLHGIVFDQPHAAERARKQIAEAGLAERCEAVGGDFFKHIPTGADAYILKHVIHDWADDRAITILRNCRRAMGNGGRLLIVEGVYPPRIDASLASRGAAVNDVNMLVNTGGRQRSEAEFRTLYSAAGFELTSIIPTRARVSVIEGVPARVPDAAASG
jgi:SAM-dependent methyltransferase/DNA-binding transcriptional ArsR family regulator